MGKSVIVQGINLAFGSEIKDDCSSGKLEIFNGCDTDRFLVEEICLRRSDNKKGTLWVSSGSCVTIKFSSGKRKDNKFYLSVSESVGKIQTIFSVFLTVVQEILTYAMCYIIVVAYFCGNLISQKFAGLN